MNMKTLVAVVPLFMAGSIEEQQEGRSKFEYNVLKMREKKRRHSIALLFSKTWDTQTCVHMCTHIQWCVYNAVIDFWLL